MNMNKTWLFVLLIAGVLRGAGSITGVVVDPNGAVIPGSSITLRADGIEKHSRSGVEGRFAFGALNPGTYVVEVTFPGFKTTTTKPIQVLDVAVDVGKVTLAVGPVMTSCPDPPPIPPTIAWLDGSPGIDGTVGIPNRASASEIEIRIRGASITPDGNGRFSFPDLTLGTYSLTVHLSGYADFVIDSLTVKEDKRTQIVDPLPLRRCPEFGACIPIRKMDLATICL
jgi:Carboxypeptidase regulatory-like domain